MKKTIGKLLIGENSLYYIFLRNLPKGRLAQNTLLSLFWQGSRLLFLSLWIVLFARCIGAEQYGFFAGISGAATAMGSFVGLGFGLVMFQDAIRSPQLLDELWFKTLTITLLSGVAFLLIFFGLSIFLFPNTSFILLFSIALSELVFFPIMTSAAFAFAAKERTSWASALPTLMASFRLVALVLFLYLGATTDLTTYMRYHLVATLAASTLCVWLVDKKLSIRRMSFKLKPDDFLKGTYFCATWASGNALGSLDKFAALKLAGPEVSGLYSAAHRFTYILLQPIDALIVAAMPRLFTSKAFTSKATPILKHLFICVILYGALAGALISCTPNLLISILGKEFSQLTDVIGWCGLLIPCYGLRTLITNILMACDLVKLKIAIELCGLCIMFSLGALLIPQYGLKGTIAMLVGTEFSLAAISSIIFVIMKFKFSNKFKK